DFLVCKNVNVVTAFSLGPRAFEKFKNYNIKIYKALDGTILDNIQKFKDNKLREIKNKDIF
ncbi:NifB/NifX family molybdenum-iron cluster-binding protein, partial [Candidatus Parcubacteria bacterium]|nr:NifB/NifX family molybdenum-iron cluster-binding protein [Candidatus Parcubacteria bacterium]